MPPRFFGGDTSKFCHKNKFCCPKDAKGLADVNDDFQFGF